MKTLTTEGFGDISDEVHIMWPFEQCVATLWLGSLHAGKAVFVKESPYKAPCPIRAMDYRQLDIAHKALLTELAIKQDFEGLAWCHFIFHAN